MQLEGLLYHDHGNDDAPVTPAQIAACFDAIDDVAKIIQTTNDICDEPMLPAAQIAAMYEKIEGQKDSSKKKSYLMPPGATATASADKISVLGVGGSQVPEDPLTEALTSDQAPVAAVETPTPIPTSNHVTTTTATNQGVPTASLKNHSSASHQLTLDQMGSDTGQESVVNTARSPPRSIMEASSNKQSRSSVPNFHAEQAALVENKVFEATIVSGLTPESPQAGNDPQPSRERRRKSFVFTDLVLIIGAMTGIIGPLLSSQGDTSGNTSGNENGSINESDFDVKVSNTLPPSTDGSPKPSSTLTKDPSIHPSGGPSLVPSDPPSEIATLSPDVYGASAEPSPYFIQPSF